MPEGKDRSHATGGSARGARERLIADRYLVLRQLGQGGMGRVWLAADELLGRLVAIKELRPPSGLADADRQIHQRRALQEARSAARIQHPNAVTLHEVVAVAGDDAIYLIMEFVEGPTLGELIAEYGPLPASRAARYGLQLLDVLAAAHALGIVHRDVKPDNILIAAGDQAKLADFGIAHTLGDPRLTTGGIMGTRAYLAPELFDEAPITPAADLWSLGATLYHAAEGHGAFDKEGTGAMLRAILLDDIQVPRCDPCLAEAITGLLHRDPRERFTIEQAGTLLRQVPGQQPAPQPPPTLQSTRPDPRPTPPDPQPVPARVRAGNRNWNPDADTGRNLPTGAQAPPASPPSAEKHPIRFLPGKRWAVAAAAVLVLAAGGTVGGLLATSSHAGNPNSSGSFSSTPAAASSHAASATSGPATRASASNGTSSATSSGNAPPPSGSTASGALSLSKTINGPAGIPQSGIAYSPNGSMLATYGANDGSDAILWNPATDTSTDLPFGTGAPDVAFSYDSRTVAVAERYGGVGLWSAATRKQTSNVSDDYFATGIAFNPRDDNMLAVGDGDGIRLLNLSTRTWSAPLAGSAGATGPWTVTFSPNGNTLAAVDRRTGYVYVWKVSTGALLGKPIPPKVAGDLPSPGTSIGYTPDSALLAIGYSIPSAASPGIQFWAVQKQGVVSHMEYPGVGDVNALAYDPAESDDYAVVGTNGHMVLWELPAGHNLGDVLNLGGAPLVDVVFNPDAKTIATLDANDRISLWNVTGVG